MRRTRHHTGFSLVELLVTLAIIGILLALLIPMIARGRENQTKIAVLRETVTTLMQVVDEGLQNEQIQPGTAFGTYMLSRITADLECPAVAVNEGCWPADSQTIAGASPQNGPGLKMANGAMISGLDGGQTNGEWSTVVAVDWNGNTLPNQIGRDQVYLNLCYGASTCTQPIADQQPGTLQALPASITGSAANTDLFNQAFPPQD